MTTENNSVTGHETARQLVNKIKSQKTMAGMELHAVWIRTTLKMPDEILQDNAAKWSDICQILKKELPEVHQYLSEKKLLGNPRYDDSDGSDFSGCIVPILVIAFVLFLCFSVFFSS